MWLHEFLCISGYFVIVTLCEVCFPSAYKSTYKAFVNGHFVAVLATTFTISSCVSICTPLDWHSMAHDTWTLFHITKTLPLPLHKNVRGWSHYSEHVGWIYSILIICGMTFFNSSVGEWSGGCTNFFTFSVIL